MANEPEAAQEQEVQEEAPEQEPETPAEEPQAPAAPVAPEEPTVDPMMAQLREDLERERREKEEYRQFVMRQQQTQQAPAEQEFDVDDFIDKNLGEKSAPVMKQLVKQLEKRMEKKYAARSEFEQTKHAAMQAQVAAQEAAAVAAQREDGVPEDVLKEARGQIMTWAKQGRFFPDAQSAYDAAVGQVVKKRMFGEAARAQAAKAAVKARQGNAAAPRSETPGLPASRPKREKGESIGAYLERLQKIEIGD